MVATSVAEFEATGRASTRLFQTLVAGNSGQADVGGAATAGPWKAPNSRTSAITALRCRFTGAI